MSRLLNEEHGGGALALRQWSSDQECVDSGGRSLVETSSIFHSGRGSARTQAVGKINGLFQEY